MQQSCWSTSFAHALRRACLRIPHLWFASLGESAWHFPVEDPLSCHHCWRKGANPPTKGNLWYWGDGLILVLVIVYISHPRYWPVTSWNKGISPATINKLHKAHLRRRGSQAMRDSKQQTTPQKWSVGVNYLKWMFNQQKLESNQQELGTNKHRCWPTIVCLKMGVPSHLTHPQTKGQFRSGHLL